MSGAVVSDVTGDVAGPVASCFTSGFTTFLSASTSKLKEPCRHEKIVEMAKSKGLDPLNKFKIVEFIKNKKDYLERTTLKTALTREFVNEVRAVINGFENVITLGKHEWVEKITRYD
jgi:hypothetical protein